MSPTYRWELFTLSLLLDIQTLLDILHLLASLLDWQSNYTSHLLQHLQLTAVKKLVTWKNAIQFWEICRFWVTIVVTVCLVGLQFKQESSSRERWEQAGWERQELQDVKTQSAFQALHLTELNWISSQMLTVLHEFWNSIFQGQFILKKTPCWICSEISVWSNKTIIFPGIIFSAIVDWNLWICFCNIFLIHACWFSLPLSYFSTISRWNCPPLPPPSLLCTWNFVPHQIHTGKMLHIICR